MNDGVSFRQYIVFWVVMMMVVVVPVVAKVVAVAEVTSHTSNPNQHPMNDELDSCCLSRTAGDDGQTLHEAVSKHRHLVNVSTAFN